MARRYTIKVSIHEVRDDGSLDEVAQEWDSIDYATKNVGSIYTLFDLLLDEGDNFFEAPSRQAQASPLKLGTEMASGAERYPHGC